MRLRYDGTVEDSTTVRPDQRLAQAFLSLLISATKRQRQTVIRVLVVDPENRMGADVAHALEGQVMLPTVVSSAEETLNQLQSKPPHAVVLAASPSDDGDEELCRAICERTLAPVLVVGRADRQTGLERLLSAGADAHVLEPLTAQVLVAQLWALLRRVGLTNSRPAT
jgi:DNA-binding response OmpR family regulator